MRTENTSGGKDRGERSKETSSILETPVPLKSGYRNRAGNPKGNPQSEGFRQQVREGERKRKETSPIENLSTDLRVSASKEKNLP